MLATILSELYYQLLFVNDATQVSGAQAIMVCDIVQVSHEISTNKNASVLFLMSRFSGLLQLCPNFVTLQPQVMVCALKKDAFIMTVTTGDQMYESNIGV